MKILLDTNVIIAREGEQLRNEGIGELFRWLDKLSYEKNIHPLTIKEIGGYHDQKIVDLRKIKIENYIQLNTTAKTHEEVLEKICVNDKNENDKNDTILINELFSNRVNFLITEDKGIHKKAEILGIQDKVYYINSFLEKLVTENPGLIDYETLSVRKEYFGNIDITDEFFDSFRNDYDGFDEWFNKKSEEEAYICEQDKKILAFLYIKKESDREVYSDISPKFESDNRLKIGTFKVILNGFKIGERFLKIIFDNAIKQKVNEIYVTIFNKNEEQKRLSELLEQFGFNRWGQKNSPSGVEDVFVRNLDRLINSENPKKSYPYMSSNKNIFLNPIKPEYHTELLPDSILDSESPHDYKENKPHRNALSKIYVSGSIYNNLNKGDLILFYRTQGTDDYGNKISGGVTTIGIVESVIKNIPSILDFFTICRKRTVYSNDELIQSWTQYGQRKPFVVNFLYSYSLPKLVTFKDLIELGIIKDYKSAPRGFTKISKEDFLKIIDKSGSDKDLIL